MRNYHTQQCCSGYNHQILDLDIHYGVTKLDGICRHIGLVIFSNTQDLTGNYSGSFGTSSQSFEFVPGKGYQPKRTL